ncbi:hypothetical protein ACETU7_08100 [Rhodococcus sp. 3Y1]
MTIVAWRHLETFDPSQRARMRGGLVIKPAISCVVFHWLNGTSTALAWPPAMSTSVGSVDLSYKPTQIHDLAGADRMQGPAFASMTSRYGWIDVTGPDRRGTK